MVATLLHVHVDHHALIQEAVAALPLGHGLAAQDCHVAGHTVELGGCLDGDHLRAGFGGRARCGDARAAKAHDHDVGVKRLGHVAVGDGRRLTEPRHGARAVEAHRLAVARAGRACGTARDADHLRSAARQARAGKRRADGSGGQKATAADSRFVHVVPSSLAPACCFAASPTRLGTAVRNPLRSGRATYAPAKTRSLAGASSKRPMRARPYEGGL